MNCSVCSVSRPSIFCRTCDKWRCVECDKKAHHEEEGHDRESLADRFIMALQKSSEAKIRVRISPFCLCEHQATVVCPQCATSMCDKSECRSKHKELEHDWLSLDAVISLMKKAKIL